MEPHPVPNDASAKPETAPPILSVKNIEVIYDHVILVLKGVSLNLPKGKIVAILGANGAGKSTTLKAISNLIKAERGDVTKGSIVFEGEQVHHLTANDLVRRGCIQVMEGRHCFPHLNVEENLLTGAYTRRDGSAAIKRDLDLVYDYFPRLKQRRTSLAGYISGGEQQMTAIGRALMSRPKAILLDEPSMGLAPQLVEEIFEITKTLNEKEKVSFLLAEQNTNMALRYAKYGYILENGRVVMDGEAKALSENEDVKEFYLGLSTSGRKSYRDFGPRFGFAWRPREKWTVRGAYGIMYEGDTPNGYNAVPLGKPTSVAWGGTYFLASDPVQPWAGIFNWDNGFPTNRFQPAAFDLSWGNQSRPGMIDPEYGQTPYIQNVTFNIQREIRKFVLDVGYVANKGTRLRVGGLVKEGSIQREDGQRVRFVVTDTKTDLPVAYVGLLPDLFREGQGVVAEGVLQADHSFRADSVLAKHDENYMPREVADALKKQGVWNEGQAAAKGDAKKGAEGYEVRPTIGRYWTVDKDHPSGHYVFATVTRCKDAGACRTRCEAQGNTWPLADR